MLKQLNIQPVFRQNARASRHVPFLGLQSHITKVFYEGRGRDMVFSRKSNIYHHENCRHAQRILPCNKDAFTDEAQAHDAGYQMCSCCGAMKNRCRKILPNIIDFCIANRMKLQLFDQAVYFKTSRCWWKLKTGFGSSFMLYHENMRDIAYNRETTPFYRRDYHVQNCRCRRVLDYLQYIAAHDKWRNAVEHPRTKKEKRIARQAKNRRRRVKIAHVLSLINSLSATDVQQPATTQTPDSVTLSRISGIITIKQREHA